MTFPSGFITMAVVEDGEARWESTSAARDRAPIERVRVTPRQRTILTFLAQYRREHGRIPSYREIAAAARLSGPGPVRYQLRLLAAKGLLEHDDGKRRGITLNVTL
jgi:SOS-response transcriptional repressor LexA